jgi:hypothetical protein
MLVTYLTLMMGRIVRLGPVKYARTTSKKAKPLSFLIRRRSANLLIPLILIITIKRYLNMCPMLRKSISNLHVGWLVRGQLIRPIGVGSYSQTVTFDL